MIEIRKLMDLAVEKEASDIHLAVGRRPVLRKGGKLLDIGEMPVLTADDTLHLIREIAPERAMAEIADSGTADFAYAHEDKARFRVSAFRQREVHGMIMRLIPHRLRSFEEIGLPESVRELLVRPRGLILVTGPTGSGKSTTLATMIDWINENRQCHIVTIEDPIEYYHQHKASMVTQREVGTDVPSFGEAMRRVLRQDPDVILLGEMRDLETTSAAITAAETGHLVFGTLHTTGSARTVDRIIDQYPTNQQEQVRAQLSVSVLGVISQLLLPRADGKGLVAAFEVMILNSAIENHIRKGETFKIPSVIQTNKRAGMVLLDDHLLSLVQSGSITPKVALETAQDPAGLEGRLLQARGG